MIRSMHLVFQLIVNIRILAARTTVVSTPVVGISWAVLLSQWILVADSSFESQRQRLFGKYIVHAACLDAWTIGMGKPRQKAPAKRDSAPTRLGTKAKGNKKQSHTFYSTGSYTSLEDELASIGLRVKEVCTPTFPASTWQRNIGSGHWWLNIWTMGINLFIRQSIWRIIKWISHSTIVSPKVDFIHVKCHSLMETRAQSQNEKRVFNKKWWRLFTMKTKEKRRSSVFVITGVSCRSLRKLFIMYKNAIYRSTVPKKLLISFWNNITT